MIDMDERFGFIREKLDIKILILFILRHLPEAVSFDTLTELTLCDDGISYFDFSECLEELVQTGHVSTNGLTYAITEKGVKNGTVTESGIPYSVRIKAEKKVTALSRALTRNSMISTAQTIRRGGGYTVTLSLSDGVGEIVSMDVFAINEAQANALEQGFIKNAEGIYNKLIDMILEEEPS